MHQAIHRTSAVAGPLRCLRRGSYAQTCRPSVTAVTETADVLSADNACFCLLTADNRRILRVAFREDLARIVGGAMISAVLRPLLDLEGRNDVTLVRLDGAIVGRLFRGDVEITVTLAENVLEWFVDVRHVTTDASVSDWLDYRGYDDTSEAELARDMAGEVAQFIEGVMARELRFVPDRKRPTKGTLEWLVEGRWSQVIPFHVESPE